MFRVVLTGVTVAEEVVWHTVLVLLWCVTFHPSCTRPTQSRAPLVREETAVSPGVLQNLSSRTCPSNESRRGYLVLLEEVLDALRAHGAGDAVLVLSDDGLHEGDPAHQLLDGVARR